MELPVLLDGKIAIRKNSTALFNDFCILKGELYNIKVHTVALMIQCLAGVLWVTKENDPDDYLLQRGQSLSFIPGGLIVIQALCDGKFRVISD